MNLITDNKKFGKTVTPLFSEKDFCSKKITLLEGDGIISEEAEVARKFNNYFSNVVHNLNIEGFETDYISKPELDDISNIIEKFKNHPSIKNIKENVNVDAKFHFEDISESSVQKQMASLNKKKPSTFNNIPAKILVENSDIISPFITKIYNISKFKSEFPPTLKLAQILPQHIKRVIGQLMITIDQLVFFLLFLRFLREICLIKCFHMLTNIYPLFYLGFAKATAQSTVSSSCLRSGKKQWTKANLQELCLQIFLMHLTVLIMSY